MFAKTKTRAMVARMKRGFVWTLLAAILAMAAGATAIVANPVLRTRGYFALQRTWAAGWPFERGKALPTRLRSAAQPLVPVWVRVEPHIAMLLDPNDLVSREILKTGAWEPASWRAIERHLPDGGTFVDVGAHIGYYTLKAAPVVGPAGHVIAVEPNPDTVRKLRGNVQASQASVVSVQPVACSDAEGSLELFAAPDSNTGETSLSRANASSTGAVVRSYKVRARPLDDIIRDAGVSRVDAVKIDVEGAELLVLKGAQQTLAKYRPTVIVELIDRQLKAMGTNTAEVTELMRAHGYTLSHRYGENVEFTAGTLAIKP